MSNLKFYLRLFLVALVGAVVALVVILCVPFVGRANLNWLFCSWGSFFARKILGWKIVAEDRALVFAPGSAVCIGNHQSGLDFFVSGLFCPPGCVPVVKKELRWVPFLGFYLMASRAIFLHRAKRDSALKALTAAGNDMKSHGLKVGMYPEGTRNASPEVPLLPFKKGAFILAIQAQVPIRIVISSRLWPLYSWAERRWSPGRLVIRALPELPTAGMTLSDVDLLMGRCFALMKGTVEEISDPQYKPHVGHHQVEIYQ
jgi:lysophosphatidate acyltransferase